MTALCDDTGSLAKAHPSGSSPAVSVIMPVYNAGSVLRDAVESALEQTFGDLEILAIDDGSTDDSPAVLESYGESLRRFHQSNAGPAVARNRGILEARGDYLAFLDADDVWEPEKLEKQIDLLDSRPDAVLAYTDSRDQTERGLAAETRLSRYASSGGSDSVFEALLQRNFIHTSSVVVRREALARAGLFDPTLRGAEDLELWLRLALAGPFVAVEEPLTRYRRHEGNTVNSPQFCREALRARELMLARWGRDPRIARLIRRAMGNVYWDWGFKEWTLQNFGNARAAYWKSAVHGTKPLGSLFRAALCCLPDALLSHLISRRSAARHQELTTT